MRPVTPHYNTPLYPCYPLLQPLTPVTTLVQPIAVSCSSSGRGARHVSVSSSVLSWQPLLAPLIAPPPPACWITTTGESYLASSMPSVKWEKWVGRPHGHPPPKTGSGGLVWTSKLTRQPLPNPDLPAPQLPTPQHQTRMELQDADAPYDAGAQSRPFGPKNVL